MSMRPHDPRMNRLLQEVLADLPRTEQDYSAAATASADSGDVDSALWYGAVAAAATARAARHSEMSTTVEKTIERHERLGKGRGWRVWHETIRVAAHPDYKVTAECSAAAWAAVDAFVAEMSATVADTAARIAREDARRYAIVRERRRRADALDDAHWDPHWDVSLLNRKD